MAYGTGKRMDADAAAYHERLGDLRLFVEALAEHTLRQPLPETYLDAERAVRGITVSDRFLQAVPPDETAGNAPAPATEVPTYAGEGQTPRPGASPVRDPWRLRLRAHADKVMHAAATEIDKPESHLEAWRAQRYAWAAKAMLTQLYVPPVVKPKRYDPDNDFEDDGDPDRPLTLEEQLYAIQNHPKGGKFSSLMRDWKHCNDARERQIREGLNPPPLEDRPEDNDPEYREYLMMILRYKLGLKARADANHRAWEDYQAAKAAARDEHPPP